MLIFMGKQWPGFPGVFKSIMAALQMYNKKNVIDFLQGEGIQVFTQILFALLGRWYGQNHPEIGEILGVSPRTVNKHLEQVFPKLGVENRTAAAGIAIRLLNQY